MQPTSVAKLLLNHLQILQPGWLLYFLLAWLVIIFLLAWYFCLLGGSICSISLLNNHGGLAKWPTAPVLRTGT